MGFRGLHLSSLVLVLMIVLLIFGTKRLRNIGNDLGVAIRNFRKGLGEPEAEKPKDS